MRLINALKTGLSLTLFAALCGSVFVIAVIPFELRMMATVRDWPQREGVVARSYPSHRTSSGGLGATGYWVPAIQVQYADTGELVWIERVRYGDIRWGDGQRSAANVVAQYPPGAVVRVAYSPGDPTDTVLEPFAPWDQMLVLLGGAVGILLIPIGLVLWRKLRATL